MKTVEIQLSDQAFLGLDRELAELAGELRVAAAVKWYETGVVSQGKAAEIAGLSRAAFINALNQFSVSTFQYSADEIVSEVTRR